MANCHKPRKTMPLSSNSLHLFTWEEILLRINVAWLFAFSQATFPVNHMAQVILLCSEWSVTGEDADVLSHLPLSSRQGVLSVLYLVWMPLMCSFVQAVKWQGMQMKEAYSSEIISFYKHLRIMWLNKKAQSHIWNTLNIQSHKPQVRQVWKRLKSLHAAISHRTHGSGPEETQTPPLGLVFTVYTTWSFYFLKKRLCKAGWFQVFEALSNIPALGSLIVSSLIFSSPPCPREQHER